MTIDYRNIGAKIQYYRTQKGISQESLAESAAISRVFLSNLERGEKGSSLETFVAIVNALRISADDILADNLRAGRPSVYAICLDVFGDCSKEEADFLQAVLQHTKQLLRKYHISE